MDLTSEQKEYAAKDVLYLHQIRAILQDMLLAENRLDIAKQIFNFLPIRANTIDRGIIGYIDSYDNDCEYLTWTTDGIYAGTVFVRNGNFSMTTHCGALITKIANISLEYVYSYLTENLKTYAKGTQNKRVTVEIIKNVKVKIPITQAGKFDLQTQKEIAEKCRKIEEIKRNLKAEIEKIENIMVDIGLY